MALSSQSRFELLGFAAGGGLCLLVIVGIALVVSGRSHDVRADRSKADAGKAVRLSDEEETRRRQQAEWEKSLPTREEFAAKMIGKTKEQVVAEFGRPRDPSRWGDAVWTYAGLTRDTVAGRTDYHTVLWFDNAGKVSRITH